MKRLPNTNSYLDYNKYLDFVTVYTENHLANISIAVYLKFIV